jgi:pSer/pThr/pTyr-binding forkhead associated (FHA) protein
MASTHTAACAVQIATGPLAGKRFVLDDKLEIGRGEGADIQLADPRVSRSHAMLMAEGGRITLVDTLSVNGTWVGPQRISRAELRVGDCFTIGGSMFELARAQGEAAPQPSAGPTSPTARRPGATMQLEPLDVTTIVGEEEPAPPPADPDRPDEFMPLLLDVASFRILRLQHARGELTGDKRTRYEALAARFLVRDGDSSVASLARFGVEIPAEVVFSNRRDLVHPTRISELGADGAKIVVASPLAPAQTLGWLSIHLRGASQTRTIVFVVRAEWTRGTTMEISLCGAPTWG